MDKNNVIALSENNYSTWKIQMKMHLISHDLFGIVTGTETAPSEDQASAVIRFNGRKDKALAMIVLAVEPRLLYILGDPVDPTVVWDKLASTFQKKTWANKLRLRKRLYSMQLKTSNGLQEHLKKFAELFSEMAVVGDVVDDEDQVICLLASLPDEYSTLVTALEASEKVPTWDVVTERLIHEENKFIEKGSESSSAFLTKSHSNQDSRKFKKSVKCYNCGKLGHIKKNCRAGKNKESKDNVHYVESRDTSSRENLTFVASAFSCITDKNQWIIDSGASQHMCNNRSHYVSYELLSEPSLVVIGDGKTIEAKGVGSVSLKLSLPNGKYNDCLVNNVLYVPNLSCNLLSVGKLGEKGKVVSFGERTCEIRDSNDELLALGNKTGKLYYLSLQLNSKLDHVNNSDSISLNVVDSSNDTNLWHRRFCHLGYDNMMKLTSKNLVTGIDCIFSKNNGICSSCCDGKNHRLPFPTFTSQSIQRKPLELVHSDICGRITPSSLGGANYFLTFIDDATKFSWVYFIKCKSECFDKFKEWKLLVENQFNSRVKILRTDNGGEYCSNVFQNFLISSGIKHEKTIPYTPEQNSVAERLNRTLIESVRCMLSDSSLPKAFWAEALATSVYVKNRSPANSLKDLTPYEALFGLKPCVKHFKIFGCICFSHIPKIQRQKLDFKSKKCIFVGYSSESKAYRVFDVENRKTILCRDVIFDENNIASYEKSDLSDVSRTVDVNSIFDINDKFEKNNSDVNTSINDNMPSVNPCVLPLVDTINLDGSHNDEHDDRNDDHINDGHIRRSSRVRKSVNRYGDWVYLSNCSSDPTNVKEALDSHDSCLWQEAMNKEIHSINENKVWTLAKLPSDVKPINCKWVFKRKIAGDGSLSTYKARLVAQGYTQKLGINYDETFAPVVRFESVRSILSLAVNNNFKLHQMDVSCAFLNGELNEEIYLSQPPNFVVKGKENYYLKLNKSLYGLKQSPRCWNSALDNFLKDIGFIRSSSDSCIYVRAIDDDLCIIAVYVDDIIIACKLDSIINDVKSSLSNRFQMKDLGVLRYFLGVNIEQDLSKGTIFVHQSTFVKNLLNKFEFQNAKPVKTPIDISSKSSTSNDNLCDKVKYQSLVGSLLYLSTKTRPDIAFAVSNAARYCSSPTEFNLMRIKRILRYLNGTIDYGILYTNKCNFECVGYSDSDWAGDVKDRKSTSGYCFIMNGGLISWKSCKQTCVSLSTAEAEYVALAACTQEAVWLIKLLKDLNLNINLPMLINEDNQSAIAIAKNPKDHPKTKHIAIKYHFVRDKIVTNEICLKYCATDAMIADIFTKGLSSEKFIKLRSLCGMLSFSEYKSM